ncbi:hypothetical protein HAX54_034831, partial [Datura stramonium]|nr:hypothetical protein [Datura stramonium]
MTDGCDRSGDSPVNRDRKTVTQIQTGRGNMEWEERGCSASPKNGVWRERRRKEEEGDWGFLCFAGVVRVVPCEWVCEGEKRVKKREKWREIRWLWCATEGENVWRGLLLFSGQQWPESIVVKVKGRIKGREEAVRWLWSFSVEEFDRSRMEVTGLLLADVNGGWRLTSERGERGRGGGM